MPKIGQRLKGRTTPEPPPVSGARWVALTQGKFALVNDADFAEINRHAWSYHWQGYAFRKAPEGAPGAKMIRMHRQIMGVTDPALKVDHIHGNTLDNRRQELRVATQTENGRNNRGHRRRTTPFKGVSHSGRAGKPWAAKITVNSLTVNLGRFALAADAARAYDRAARDHFGEFARCNFPADLETA